MKRSLPHRSNESDPSGAAGAAFAGLCRRVNHERRSGRSRRLPATVAGAFRHNAYRELTLTRGKGNVSKGQPNCLHQMLDLTYKIWSGRRDFEPSTPTLARLCSEHKRDFRPVRPCANEMRIMVAAPQFTPATGWEETAPAAGNHASRRSARSGWHHCSHRTRPRDR